MGRVLVVDDNEDTCKIMAAVLARSGHEGECTTDPREAVERVRRHPPDMVILDLMMPYESGLEVLRELRSDPSTSQLPVIIYSAVSEPRYVKEAMDSGATDYWLKGTLRGLDLQTRLKAFLPDVIGWAESPNAHPLC